jgi:dynein heavy chain, axonemal
VLTFLALSWQWSTALHLSVIQLCSERRSIFLTHLLCVQRSEEAVQELNEQLRLNHEELASLQRQTQLAEKRLHRAGTLTESLADEAVRWQEAAECHQLSMDTLAGDTFLAAACISYMGPFAGLYRSGLLADWVQACQRCGLATAQDFSLRRFMQIDMEARQWRLQVWLVPMCLHLAMQVCQHHRIARCHVRDVDFASSMVRTHLHLQGLPPDDVLTDNAIIVTRTHQWPLLIDPQLQGQTWLTVKEADHGLTLLRSSDASFLQSLEQHMAAGSAVLLCDVGESFDSCLEQLLKKEVITGHGRTTVKLGNADVDYNQNFRMYLATGLPNAHFPPEVQVRLSVINFTITAESLTDQLLADTVRHEQPELQQQKDQVVVALAKDRQQLADLQSKILALLQSTQGNILDDDEVVSTLDSSRITSSRIKQSVQISEAAERDIDTARGNYLAVPNRGSLLFFEMMRLPQLSPMYHFSLVFFKHLYQHCLTSSNASDILQARPLWSACLSGHAVQRVIQTSLSDAERLVLIVSTCAGATFQPCPLHHKTRPPDCMLSSVCTPPPCVLLTAGSQRRQAYWQHRLSQVGVLLAWRFSCCAGRQGEAQL